MPKKRKTSKKKTVRVKEKDQVALWRQEYRMAEKRIEDARKKHLAAINAVEKGFEKKSKELEAQHLGRVAKLEEKNKNIEAKLRNADKEIFRLSEVLRNKNLIVRFQKWFSAGKLAKANKYGDKM